MIFEEDNIEIARLFALKCLNNKLQDLTPSDYYILQISKFILLKESMIIKDLKENSLYFNYDKFRDYIDNIIEVANIIVHNSTILKIKNVLNVHITGSYQNDNPSLEAAILLVHKLRDIFAHGNYKIDIKNHVIMINNDTQDAHIVSYIPLSVLEKITHLPKGNEFDFDIINNRKEFNFNEKDIDSLSDYRILSLKKDNPQKISKNDIDSNFLKIDYDYDKMDDGLVIKPSNININYSKIYKTVNREKQLYVLKMMLAYLNKQGLSHKDLKEIADLFKEYGLIKKIGISQETANINISRLVDEVADIIGIKNERINSYQLVSIYNYMQILLSNQYDSLWSMRPPVLSHLKLSKLHPMFTTKPKIDEAINRNIKDIIRRTRKTLDKYYSADIRYQDQLLKLINDSFKVNINNILKQLSTRNIQVITGIRNSIEHGNITEIRGHLVLYDKDNQTNNNSVNFACFGKIKDYYEFTERINKHMWNYYTPLTNQELLVELKEIIDPDTYQNFSNLIDEIEKLNKKRAY